MENKPNTHAAESAASSSDKEPEAVSTDQEPSSMVQNESFDTGLDRDVDDGSHSESQVVHPDDVMIIEVVPVSHVEPYLTSDETVTEEKGVIFEFPQDTDEDAENPAGVEFFAPLAPTETVKVQRLNMKQEMNKGEITAADKESEVAAAKTTTGSQQNEDIQPAPERRQRKRVDESDPGGADKCLDKPNKDRYSSSSSDDLAGAENNGAGFAPKRRKLNPVDTKQRVGREFSDEGNLADGEYSSSSGNESEEKLTDKPMTRHEPMEKDEPVADGYYGAGGVVLDALKILSSSVSALFRSANRKHVENGQDEVHVFPEDATVLVDERKPGDGAKYAAASNRCSTDLVTAKTEETDGENIEQRRGTLRKKTTKQGKIARFGVAVSFSTDLPTIEEEVTNGENTRQEPEALAEECFKPANGTKHTAASSSSADQPTIKIEATNLKSTARDVAESPSPVVSDTPEQRKPVEAGTSSAPGTDSLKMKRRVFKGNRCGECECKLGLTAIQCRCGNYYCAKHRYDRAHDCTFDYKALGAEEIRKNNPKVVAEKVRKL